MLQQRAAHKYHSPLLWTNTCCSHQRDGEYVMIEKQTLSFYRWKDIENAICQSLQIEPKYFRDYQVRKDPENILRGKTTEEKHLYWQSQIKLGKLSLNGNQESLAKMQELALYTHELRFLLLSSPNF